MFENIKALGSCISTICKRNTNLKVSRKCKTCFSTITTGHTTLCPFFYIIKLLFSHDKTGN